MNLDHHINAACIHCMFILSYVEIILYGLNPQTWSWWLQGVCYCSLLLTCLAWFYVFTLLLAKTAASYFISQMFYFLWQFGRWNEYFLIVLIYTYLMNKVEHLLKYSQRVCLSTYLTIYSLFSFGKLMFYMNNNLLMYQLVLYDMAISQTFFLCSFYFAFGTFFIL